MQVTTGSGKEPCISVQSRSRKILNFYLVLFLAHIVLSFFVQFVLPDQVSNLFLKNWECLDYSSDLCFM